MCAVEEQLSPKIFGLFERRLVAQRSVPLQAAFATLAGVSPLQASSGRVTRHRLSGFSHGHLNGILHAIVRAGQLEVGVSPPVTGHRAPRGSRPTLSGSAAVVPRRDEYILSCPVAADAVLTGWS